jgi:hypothetical protein
LNVQGGDEDGEGGGSDIGALLGNLGPLIGGLSGVSQHEYFNDKLLNYMLIYYLETNKMFLSTNHFERTGWR